MFSQLPTHIQHQILFYLETNNFIAAKKLRDTYLQKRFAEAA